ncbi:MAG: (5-formylfuran-3-yl)methyl phosphate synthase [Bacillota bacterium]
MDPFSGLEIPQLLVSVVDAEEGLAAMDGGAGIIDVKNPHEGALGAQPPSVIRAVCQAVAGKRPVSAALGEFPGRPGGAGLAALGAACCGPDYVKVGFPGKTHPAEMAGVLRSIRDSLGMAGTGHRIGLVAAVYADTLGGRPLEEWARLAASAGCDGCLVDTWNKSGPGLLGLVPARGIQRFIHSCREEGIFSALAGKLAATDIPRVAALGPEIIGVRSAACEGDRVSGRVTRHRVSDLVRALGQPLPVL